MSPTQTQTELDDEEARHYRGVLRILVDLGSKMAADIAGEAATRAEPNTPKPDHTIAFERVSRTIRRCILLARKLAEPLPQSGPASNPPDRTAARKRIIRVVEDAIDRERHTHGVEVEPLEAELLDRLDRPDIDDDLATRPIDEIIADIARDLGVGFPLDETFRVWKRRTPEDVEALQARAAEPRPPKCPRVPEHRGKFPDDPAQAVANVLAARKIRDG